MQKPNTLKIIQYMKAFQCLGPDCPQTCCMGWTLLFQKEEVARIKKLTRSHPTLKERFKVLEKKLDILGTPGERLECKLGENEPCGFFDQGICSLHQHFGESKLFKICAIYPRRRIDSGECSEISGALSCPEVTRLCLDLPDAFDWVESSWEQIPPQLIWDQTPRQGNAWFERAIWKVRSWFMEILQCPDLKLDQKHYLLLYFSKNVNSFFHADQFEDFSQKLERNYLRLIAPETRSRTLKGYESLSIGSVELLQRITEMIITSRFKHKDQSKFNTFIKDLLASYPTYLASDDSPLTHIWDQFLLRQAEVKSRYGPEVEFCLERISMQFWSQNFTGFFRRLFSFGRFWVINLAVLRFLIYNALYLAEKPENGTEWVKNTIAEVIYVYVRTMFHNTGFEEWVDESSDQLKLDSLSALIPFIKAGNE